MTMIEDITTTFEKRLRQTFCNKFYDIPYLKEFVYKESDNIAGLIKAYTSNSITCDKPDAVYRITDQSFKNCLINESNLQFDKALYNWSAYKRLVSQGLWSWAYVTLYYAQFYCINGLINLQGNAFSRPSITTNTGEAREVQFHIYTDNFREGMFIFEMRRLNKPHEDVWRQYYELYRNCRYKLAEFSDLYQYDSENQFEAVNLRNSINYDISFEFLEYLLSAEEIEQFADKMSQDIFAVPYSEDDNLKHEFIASLRIKLLFELCHEILGIDKFDLARTRLHSKREAMLNNTHDDTPVKNIFLKWVSNSD